jgi:hypothetical protein
VRARRPAFGPVGNRALIAIIVWGDVAAVCVEDATSPAISIPRAGGAPDQLDPNDGELASSSMRCFAQRASNVSSSQRPWSLAASKPTDSGDAAIAARCSSEGHNVSSRGE